jgi:hypothetical protein
VDRELKEDLYKRRRRRRRRRGFISNRKRTMSVRYLNGEL